MIKMNRGRFKSFFTGLPAALIVLIIALSFNGLLISATRTSDQDSLSSATFSRKNDNSNSYKNDNNNQDLNIINLEEENTGEDVESQNRFDFRDHQDDHSLYAHRSLMSTENIVRQSSNAKNEDRGAKHNAASDSDEHEAIKKMDFAEKEWQLMFRSFDMMYDNVAGSIISQIGKQTDLFEEIVSKLKPECKRDIYHIRDSAKKHKLWALRMMDSMGKMPSGITYGRFSSPGDFEECLSVKVDELVRRTSAANAPAEHFEFRGQYCLLDFRLPLPERPQNKILSIHDPVIDLSKTELGKQFPEIANYSGYASVFYEVGYMHGFCLPSSCDVMDLARSVGQALEGLHIIVNNTVDCEVRQDGPAPYRGSQVIALTLIILLFVNATIATVVHHLKTSNKWINNSANTYPTARDTIRGGNGQVGEKHKEAAESMKWSFKEWAGQKIKQGSLYAECFSIQTNFNRLTKPDPRGLAFVHYTRIVAMALTVITHTAGLGTLQAITKPTDTSNSEQIFRDFIPQMLANAFTSIQIFFFMAGFMLVISTYPSIKREKGHVSFLEYGIKRAIRLMPGIAATICLNFLWPLIVDGPMLSYFIRLIVVPCETNWWRTMAFLSNFDHVEKMCLRHSYFSASDYQLHIMAFPLLILLYRQPSLSLFIAGILTVAGFVAQVIMITTKTVLPFMMVDYIDKEAFFNVVHYIHHPVWNHMSAFFYGFIIGYFVVKQIRIELSEKTIKWLWIIILPSGIASIFAPYFWNHYKRPIYRWQMVLYVIFDRFILLTTCAWLSYATMVLGRKKPSQARPTAPPNLNLPNIVKLEQDSLKEKSPQTPDVPTTASGNGQDNLTPFEQNRLQQSSSTNSIPRPRSSPNIASLGPSGETLPMRTVASSANIALSANKQEVSAQATTPTTAASVHPRGSPPTHRHSGGPERKSSPPVTEVNTLCLILSRLTFQLYLFNMVVLWVDVNHSKYFWFFSYYFIITKALAVYICSSLMAMVFFITLESPSLTLYIMWVKNRAQSRANKRERREQSSASKEDSRPAATTKNFNGKLTSVDDAVADDRRPATEPSKRHELVATFDGLCMRQDKTGDVSNKVLPTLSFIDLSSPTNASEKPAASDDGVSGSRTRM